MNRVNDRNDTHQHDHIGSPQAEPNQDTLRRVAEGSTPSDKPIPTDEFDVQRVIAATLLQIQDTLSKLDARITELHSKVEPAAVPKEWYSIDEAAAELGKAEFTVREWCRFNRINAHKRECGRGRKREWMISQKELERIRNKGLLPANL
jgi:hypothetical protein